MNILLVDPGRRLLENQVETSGSKSGKWSRKIHFCTIAALSTEWKSHLRMHHGSSCFLPTGSWKWWLWRIFEVWHSGGSDLEARHPCGSFFWSTQNCRCRGLRDRNTHRYISRLFQTSRISIWLWDTAFFVDQNLFVGSCWIQYSQHLKARCFIQLHPHPMGPMGAPEHLASQTWGTPRQKPTARTIPRDWQKATPVWGLVKGLVKHGPAYRRSMANLTRDLVIYPTHVSDDLSNAENFGVQGLEAHRISRRNT